MASDDWIQWYLVCLTRVSADVLLASEGGYSQR